MRLRQPKTLITGKPGVGKTTLMRRLVVRMKPVDMRGFYTTEIRSRGQRVGYGAAMGVDHARRNSLIRLLKGLAVAWAGLPGTRRPVWAKQNRIKQEVGMKLPSPNIDGPVSVEHAIHQRRTRRSFTSRALYPDQSKYFPAGPGIGPWGRHRGGVS
jgi:GTPase SAR1 family protein